MISKMKPYSHAERTGSRIGIVFNGSPLFTGDAGSGESNIRKWIVENDWLEGIVALPDQLFYNTGINTYIWIVTNRKTRKRKGKVQLVNAVDLYSKMRKSLGNKRNEMRQEHIEEIVRIYCSFTESEHSKIFDNEDFGYRKITVERPLRLSFSVTPEHIARFEASRAFEALAVVPQIRQTRQRRNRARSSAADLSYSPPCRRCLMTRRGRDRERVHRRPRSIAQIE